VFQNTEWKLSVIKYIFMIKLPQNTRVLIIHRTEIIPTVKYNIRRSKIACTKNNNEHIKRPRE